MSMRDRYLPGVQRSFRRLLLLITGILTGIPLVRAADETFPTQGVQADGRAPAREMRGLPLVFFDNFEATAADHWEQSDSRAWKLITTGSRRVLSQFQQSQVETPVRSPFNRALVKNLVLGNCVIDVRVQSTIKDYDHRDACLFFGFQDPAHFYYVHLGKKADDHANQIFIVNNEPRKKISATSTTGTPWTDDWHHVRVIRFVEAGTISVYFDDMEKPAMTAEDRTFTWGQVGVGTFDDTANFDDVCIYGRQVERKK